MPQYEIEFSTTALFNVTVEATDEEEAEEKLRDRFFSDPGWQPHAHSYEEDIKIDSVTKQERELDLGDHWQPTKGD
jgi:hypothetical protein